VEFDHYTIALLTTPPDPPELDDDEATAIQSDHLAHLARLHDAGQLLAAGPLRDPDRRLRGLLILNVDPEHALELEQADPAVRAGVFAVEAVPWMLPAGLISFSPAFMPRSVEDVTG
jgi:uncharacterized protein YciI